MRLRISNSRIVDCAGRLLFGVRQRNAADYSGRSDIGMIESANADAIGNDLRLALAWKELAHVDLGAGFGAHGQLGLKCVEDDAPVRRGKAAVRIDIPAVERIASVLVRRNAGVTAEQA